MSPMSGIDMYNESYYDGYKFELVRAHNATFKKSMKKIDEFRAF